MKKYVIVVLGLLSFLFRMEAQNVGIHTPTPLAKLHVDVGASLSDGILFSGLDPSGGIFPSLGAGHRLMYYPGRGVFRAGYVDDTQWDNSQVGAFSFAFGYNTIARGNGSTAFGDGVYAGGTISTAFGNSTQTKGYSSFVLGMYNDPLLLGADQNVETPQTPLLMVGNGDGSSTRNNALAVFKNGDVLFRNYSTVLVDPGVKIPPAVGPGTRMMWLAEKSAFRIGTVHNDDWNADSIGTWSTGIGYSTKAKGQFSLALGLQTTASGVTSTALGYNTTARGENSMAMGSVTTALGSNSTSIGFKTYAGSYGSLAMGRYNDTIVNANRAAWINADPLLILGNGTSDNALHNTLVIYKNGNFVSKNPTPVYQAPPTFDLPVSGAGTRLVWFPELSAFSVGTYDEDYEELGIGLWSFSSGLNSRANGNASTAFGSGSEANESWSTAIGFNAKSEGEASVAMGAFVIASGDGSIAMGNSANARGETSIAMGNASVASGFRSTALGDNTVASGAYSTASGLKNLSKGFSTMVVGMYNDSILTTDQVAFDPLTPLFIVGNGDGVAVGQRSNAMVVRKDGNVGIGTSSPDSKLHINGAVKIADGTQGAGKVLTSDANGSASWQSPPPPPPPAPTYVTSISICCQSWMTKNLDVSTYRNGDAIPKVTSNSAWAALTTGAYCYYNNDSTTYAATYGKIYNWYAVNDPRGLAPEGWHIPTGFEMMTLIDCLGGTSEAGGLLKERGTTHWTTPNTGATNMSGFTALPGGLRAETGTFSGVGIEGPLWGVTEYDSIDSYYMSTAFNSATATVFHFKKKTGFYVRCIRD